MSSRNLRPYRRPRSRGLPEKVSNAGKSCVVACSPRAGRVMVPARVHPEVNVKSDADFRKSRRDRTAVDRIEHVAGIYLNVKSYILAYYAYCLPLKGDQPGVNLAPWRRNCPRKTINLWRCRA